MAVAVANVTTTTLGSGSDVAFSQPASLAAGDLMVAWISCGGTPGTPWTPPPVGWTQILTNFGTLCYLNCWWKIATSTDVSAWDGTFTMANSPAAIGHLYRITGAHATTPIDTSPDAVQTGNDTAHTTNAINPSAANCLFIACWGSDDGADLSFTWDGNYSGNATENYNTTDALNMASSYRVASGTPTNETATINSSTSHDGELAIMAVAPVAAAGANPLAGKLSLLGVGI